MAVGLGTGSTARYAVERLGERLASGDLARVVAVPTSEATRAQAEALGIPLATLDEVDGFVDVAIDGADAVEARTLHLIKGGGGALLREKMVAAAAGRFVVVVDEGKLCDRLSGAFDLPIEVTPLREATRGAIGRLPSLAAARGVPRLRRGAASNNRPDGDAPAVTDNGNYIVDVALLRRRAAGGGGGRRRHRRRRRRRRTRPRSGAAARELRGVVGVVEHGLFAAWRVRSSSPAPSAASTA